MPRNENVVQPGRVVLSQDPVSMTLRQNPRKFGQATPVKREKPAADGKPAAATIGLTEFKKRAKARGVDQTKVDAMVKGGEVVGAEPNGTGNGWIIPEAAAEAALDQLVAEAEGGGEGAGDE